MLFSPAALPGRAVFVQGHVVEARRVVVLVEGGRVRVVPVLLKLLPEHALRRQLPLRGEGEKMTH